MYIEGFSDPNIPVPLMQVSGPFRWRAGAFFKALFPADCSRAATNETLVSIIVQRQLGADTINLRIVKKIFVVGFEYDPKTKNIITKLPHAICKTHIKTILTNKAMLAAATCKACTKTKRPCCKCCSSSSDGQGRNRQAQVDKVPKYVQSAVTEVVYTHPFAGKHRPLPFEDPLHKIIIALAALVALYIAEKLRRGQNSGDGDGGEGSAGVGGTWDETGNVECCEGGFEASVSGTLEELNGWHAAAGVLLTVAALSDDADLFERGQEATTPAKDELTISEIAEFVAQFGDATGITFGDSFGGFIDWVYKRALDSGRVLEHNVAKEPFKNVHLLDSYKVDVDWAYHDDGIYMHNRRRTLYISASFVKHPSHRNLTKTSGSTDKTMFIGPELYVIAILISDKGQRVVLELRDDGAQTGKSQPNSGVYVVSTPGIRFEEGNWYLFVVSQDTNTVIEGTEPRIAAKTIGGLVLTNQYSLRFDQEPCQLDHDAVITMITGAAEPISIR
ncbi:hypothetical protein FOMG_18992 [Fusarium oxysporum f. sp. melonis 26406]|uniref:Uncharacterized protein n=1 Tax=Fusarium oxysporum f. sp. melonis 26406 TaxID=1089452 RepID=W9YYM9_FUSOX|nr:hypothetical protein FOMG_18992 [Fusarium oxysporum f. sp. melonis 26406]